MKHTQLPEVLDLTIYDGKQGCTLFVCLTEQSVDSVQSVPEHYNCQIKILEKRKKNKHTHNSTGPFVLEVEVVCGMTLHTVAVDLFFIAAAQ